MYRFITIEGNIGAGKTTLANMLAEHLNAKLVLEEFAENPFLAKFYENPQQYAFPLELFFLAERYKQWNEMTQAQDIFQQKIVSDYLFNKCLLFAKINLPQDEFQLFQKLFDIIKPRLVQPDLLIYLHAPTERLQQNIKKRQRSFEQNIADDYLIRLQDIYWQYIRQEELRTLIIDVSAADFQHKPGQFQQILTAIEQPYPPGLNYFSFSE